MTTLPTAGNEHGQAFRDVQLEQELLQEAQKSRPRRAVWREIFLPTISALSVCRATARPVPIGMGVSCSADRNIKAKNQPRRHLDRKKLESNPGKYIPEHLRQQGEGNVVSINLNQSMSEILTQLSAHPVSTRLSLNGTIIVARDIAHAKLKELIDNGEALPQYVKRSPDLLRRPGKNTRRLRLRFSRPDHRRTNGFLRRSAAIARRQHGDAGQR